MNQVNDLDPVFLSYRHTDGSSLADRAAWVFRAHGVPVWHDNTHLPPGRFPRRLQEALGSGLSGAILLVTPDIKHSGIVRDLELPALLRLEADSAFTFAIGSVVTNTDGTLDYGAPDRLLPQDGWTLREFNQFRVTDHAGLCALAAKMAARRVRRAAVDSRLLLDIQTRSPALGTVKAPLAVRTRPPLEGTSVPTPEAWEDLASFLGDLPRLSQAAGVRHLHVTGGAHLSMAFALGAAVPTTTGLVVTVADQAGEEWSTGTSPSVRLDEEEIMVEGGQDDPVAVYLNLVPLRPNRAFRDHVENGRYSRAMEIAIADREMIPADTGPALVDALRQRIGELSAGRPVHLFQRGPFPIAVLLGRACNTERVHLYELEKEAEIPTYIKAAVVSPGRSGGPVVPG